MERVRRLSRRLSHPFDGPESRRVVVGNPAANAHYPKNRVTNTKYTPFNFVPRNLAEQFSQPMNRYFLLIACLQLIHKITPVHPASTWIPLLTVLSLSATKEALDDLRRHRRDKVLNERPVRIIRNQHGKDKGKHVQVVRAMDICVGDLVCVERDHEAPCDLCVVVSANADGSCYVQTSNLDGETDYKIRSALEDTQHLLFVGNEMSSSQNDPTASVAQIEQKLSQFRATITCNPPNARIYEFDSRISDIQLLNTTKQQTQQTHGSESANGIQEGGVVTGNDHVHTLSGIQLSLSANQLMQQSALLRYTSFVWGVAVYTGDQTKLGMNKHTPKMKWTSAEIFINQLSVRIFVLQICFVLLFGAVGNYYANELKSVWYLSLDEEGDAWYYWFIVPARFLLLCSMMIPISLKVTLDFVRAFYAKLIEWDKTMFDTDKSKIEEKPKTINNDGYNGGGGAVATNTAISEDLGKINIVLTDKTGTLTENVMVFKKCLVLRGDIQSSPAMNAFNPTKTAPGTYGMVCDVFEDAGLAAHIRNDLRHRMFFTALALCHTVAAQIQTDGSYEYRSASPDEEALVKAAAKLGVRFVSREKATVTVEVLGILKRFEVLHTLEFSSDRKRMSVIVRHEGSVLLFCKGADDAVMKRLCPNADHMDTVHNELEGFASQGLRTLCVAFRPLGAHDLEAFDMAFKQANCALVERAERVARVYESIEQDLRLLGVTAIEDKLQDGVPSTISTLREAGVKFWMLTGDKFTTALQVAKACNLHDPHQPLIQLTQSECSATSGVDVTALLDKEIQVASQAQATTQAKRTLIITSAALSFILEDETRKQRFTTLTNHIESVICCRVTPLQKAQIVQLAKGTGLKTLAIGDGGNDVNMIQEAHVGVGIHGREGMQAARAADYSIGQFRFLQRLLFVHGHLSYHRTAFIAQYSFYKSLVICLIQLLYAVRTKYSGASLFNSLSLMGYNVFYTGLLPCFYVFDLNLPIKELMSEPAQYRSLQTHPLLSMSTFLRWMLRAFYQAVAVALLCVWCTGSAAHIVGTTGRVFGDEETGIVVFLALVVVQLLTIVVESHTLVTPNAVVLGGTLVAVFVFNLGFSIVPTLSMYGLMFHVLGDATVWLVVALAVVVALAPVVVLRCVVTKFAPTPREKLRARLLRKSQPQKQDGSRIVVDDEALLGI